MLVVLFLLSSLALSTVVALDASGPYFMDKSEDCISMGWREVPRDKDIYVTGKSSSTGATPSTGCYLQFRVKNKGDTLKMYFTKGSFFGDKEVRLYLNFDGKEYRLGVQTPTGQFPGPLEAVNGQLTLRLVKDIRSNKNYYFQVVVKAFRTQEEPEDESSSSGDIGYIVGIVAGIIAILIIAFIVCICCRKRRRDARGEHINDMYRNGLANDSKMSNMSGGLDNKSSVIYSDESPRSNRKFMDDPLKPKSALERFGAPPRRYEDAKRTNERSFSSGDKDYKDEKRRAGDRDLDQRTAPRETEQRQTKNDYEYQSSNPRPRSPLLSDLAKNPRFRRSFHESEANATGNGRTSDTNESVESSVSSRPGAKPKLPPVPRSPPRSPSPQRRGEKIAGIFRSRPSSSSSEVAKQLDGSQSEGEAGEMVPKSDVKHSLRPNRKGRTDRRRRDDNSEDEEEKRRQREKDRREEERERRRRQEEEEEEEEERRRKLKEKKKRKEEERRRREEEEEEESDRRRKKEKEDREYEGRFKKSASGRRSKGKSPRMGRSRSTGNALEEMDRQYQRSRSKSPSSVRSLNFIEDDDDDDDLDSNYMPFRRAGSKQSLYTSRSSLYGRRRKNSMGETISLSSYAVDDVDSRFGDTNKRDRMFKSTGELEMAAAASATVVRECATQTGHERAVYMYGKKTLARGRRHKMYSRGTQTGARDRRDSVGSTKSGHSKSGKLKHRTRSEESLSSRRRTKSKTRVDDSDAESERKTRRSRSRHLDESDDDDRSVKSEKRRRRQRSKSRDLSDEDDRRSKRSHSRPRDLDSDDSRPRNKPKARPRKSAGASVDLTDSDLESTAPSSVLPPPPPEAQGFAAPYIPNYPVVYPPGVAVPYPPVAPGGPPLMMVKQPNSGHAPNKPAVAPKPKMNKSKWDTLVEITDTVKQRRRQMGESVTDVAETESVFSSVYSRQVPGQTGVYAPPSYNAARNLPDPNSTYSSAYPDSSARQGYQLGSYAPSESNL